MGCHFSRNYQRRRNPRMFRVYNVDDQGNDLNPGKLEVTDTDLIWYQKGKDPIRWPLRCLRRYGFDEELFSFESGRRCPTGPGIYAFRCNHAEALFNMVQECIQRAGQEDHLRASQNLLSGTMRTNSRPSSMNETIEMNGFLVPTSSSNHTSTITVTPSNQTALYVNGAFGSDRGPEYINTTTGRRSPSNVLDDNASALINFLHNPPARERSEPLINYADLDLPRSNENIAEAANLCAYRDEGYANIGPDVTSALAAEENDINCADVDVFTDNDCEVTHQPAYINVSCAQRTNSDSNGGSNSNCLSPEQPATYEHNYANLSLTGNNNNNGNSRSCVGKVNYIQLDLNRSSENVSSNQNGVPTSPTNFSGNPDSPTKKTESYAMIDFNKTAALSNTTRANSEDDRSLRKTRHDSTFGD